MALSALEIALRREHWNPDGPQAFALADAPRVIVDLCDGIAALQGWDLAAALSAAKLPAAKQARTEALASEALAAVVAGGFDQPAQTLLTALLADAYGTGLTNRVAYVRQALTWIGGVQMAYAAARDAVNAATTIEAVDAVTLDLSVVGPAPSVTPEGALAIAD